MDLGNETNTKRDEEDTERGEEDAERGEEDVERPDNQGACRGMKMTMC